MKYFTNFLLLLILAVSFYSNAHAQDEISAEKRKLIAELVVLTKTDQQIGEITDTMLKSLETTYPLGFKRALDSRTDLTPREKQKLEASLSENYLSFSKRFRERLPEAVNYPQYVEETVYPLYSKFFSEQELSDLVAFYKTPTGQKVVDTMPTLYAESLRLAQQNLVPKILILLDELLKEDLEKIGNPKKKTSK